MWVRVLGNKLDVWGGQPLAGFAGDGAAIRMPTFAPSSPPPWKAGAIGPRFMDRPIPESRGPWYGPRFGLRPGPGRAPAGVKPIAYPNSPWAGFGAFGGTGGVTVGHVLAAVVGAVGAWAIVGGKKGGGSGGYDRGRAQGWHEAQELLHQHGRRREARLLKEYAP